MQRRIERRPVAARLRVEPVALQDAVVERRVGVDVAFELLVVLDERRGAIALVAVGRQDGAVLSVGERDLGAVRQAQRRMPDVGGRERGIGVVGRGRKAARQRQQVLALLVEHVLLLPVEILDGEAIDRELGVPRHPLLDGGQRNGEQLRAEPGAHLRELREENLHLLAPGVHLVVALVLVVLQRDEIPDLVGQLADLVRQLVGRQQLIGTLGERALQGAVGGDLQVELVVRALPRVPVRKDVVEIPLEAISDRVPIAQRWCGWSFGGGERIHQSIIY